MQNCRDLSQIKTELTKTGFDPEDPFQAIKVAQPCVQSRKWLNSSSTDSVVLGSRIYIFISSYNISDLGYLEKYPNDFDFEVSVKFSTGSDTRRNIEKGKNLQKCWYHVTTLFIGH